MAAALPITPKALNLYPLSVVPAQLKVDTNCSYMALVLLFVWIPIDANLVNLKLITFSNSLVWTTHKNAENGYRLIDILTLIALICFINHGDQRFFFTIIVLVTYFWFIWIPTCYESMNNINIFILQYCAGFDFSGQILTKVDPGAVRVNTMTAWLHVASCHPVVFSCIRSHSTYTLLDDRMLHVGFIYRG